MENLTLEKQVQLCGKTTFRFNNITKIHDAVLSLTVFMKYFDRKHRLVFSPREFCSLPSISKYFKIVQIYTAS